MEKGSRYGKLLIDYFTDENNIYCVCDCGTRIIVTEKQLNDNSHCGCVNRMYLLSLVGADDESNDMQATKGNEHIKGRGVNFQKDKGKWRARITYQSKEYFLGYFPDRDSALEIRQEAERNLNTNFIEWYKQRKDNNVD
jgi:hypothetical protein